VTEVPALGLTLCVYELGDFGDNIDGFQVGGYGDFGAWREFIAVELENGRWGSRFPTLMMHSDCDGEWSSEACGTLKSELETIRGEMAKLPIRPFSSSWQQQVAEERGLFQHSALDCFINVNGENLVEAIARLADLAMRLGTSIIFI
jgi:hypothetical protein